MFEFKLPDIGEGVAEAELEKWYVAKGDTVTADQVLAEVTTDKATVDISTPKAGVVEKLCYEEGDVIDVGEVLVVIDDGESNSSPAPEKPEDYENAPSGEGKDSEKDSEKKSDLKENTSEKRGVIKEAPLPEKPLEVKGEKPREVVEQSTTPHQPPPMPPRPGFQSNDRRSVPRGVAQAVPAIRHLAKEWGIDLSDVVGTGPGGRVIKSDLENYQKGEGSAAPGVPTPKQTSSASDLDAPFSPDVNEENERVPLRGIRKNISRNMVLSKRKIPHYTYVEEIDMTKLEELRQTWLAKDPSQSVSPLVFIAKAVVEVLPEYPTLNSHIDEATNEIILMKNINLGIATASSEGLLVPVIKNAQTLKLRELSEQMKDVTTRAKNKQVEPAELKGGTFTITSLGKLGGLMATPIIKFPEAGILSVHKMRKEPRYIGNELVPRMVLNLAISLDHRIVDGYVGAKFIESIKNRLEAAEGFKGEN